MVFYIDFSCHYFLLKVIIVCEVLLHANEKYNLSSSNVDLLCHFIFLGNGIESYICVYIYIYYVI